MCLVFCNLSRALKIFRFLLSCRNCLFENSTWRVKIFFLNWMLLLFFCSVIYHVTIRSYFLCVQLSLKWYVSFQKTIRHHFSLAPARIYNVSLFQGSNFGSIATKSFGHKPTRIYLQLLSEITIIIFFSSLYAIRSVATRKFGRKPTRIYPYIALARNYNGHFSSMYM